MRLIQISDCHLLADKNAAKRGVKPFDELAKMLAYIKKSQQHQGFILTGDLSHEGDAPSYQLLKELFKPYQKPIYFLPGNHDDTANMREQLRELAPFVHSAALNDHWQLLLLNSQVKNQDHGRISAADLAWLDGFLPLCPQFVLVGVHHQPLPIGSAWIDDLMLENGAQLLQTLQRHQNVRALIFGHIHQEFATQLGDLQILGCPSSAFQFARQERDFAIGSELAGFRVLDLHDDGSVRSQVIRLKP